MTRIFVRIYLGLLVAIVVAGFASVGIVGNQMRDHVRDNMERMIGGPMSVVRAVYRDKLAHGVAPDAAFAELTRAFQVPASMRAIGGLELEPEDRQRLERGEIVAALTRRSVLIHVPLGPDAAGIEQVALFGPIAPPPAAGAVSPVLTLVLIVLALFVGLWLLIRPIERRLRRLRSTASAFGEGRLRARAAVDSSDGIGELATSFNGMADRIELLVLRQQELLRVVSHELRTPLQRVRFALEIARETNAADARARRFAIMDKDIGELESLIDELLTYSRLEHGPEVEVAPLDLGASVEGLVKDLALDARVAPTFARASGELIAKVDERLFRRAVGNLVSNAQRHAKTRVEVRMSADDGVVHVDVDDDGPGVPDAERTKIFEPFQRGADAEQHTGTGLGLAIVERIARRHAGSVKVERAALGGARFRLTLPRLA